MNPPRFRGNDSSKRTPFLEIRRVQHCISSGLNRNLKPELETGTSYIPSGKQPHSELENLHVFFCR